jgi:anti-anti-sigma factor
MKTVTRLALDGELAIHRAAELRQVLLGLQPGTNVELDLSEVTDADTAGLQLLLALQTQLQRDGSHLALTGASDPLCHAFTLAGLSLPQRRTSN